MTDHPPESDDANDDAVTDDSADTTPATESRSHGWVRRVLTIVGATIAALLLIVVAMAVWPASTDELESRPMPTASYDEAIARFEEVTAGESEVVFDPCRSRLFEHGERTEVAVVLFHGLTNCPRQFVELAEWIHSRGANVVFLRAPRHGWAGGGQNRIGSVSNVGPLRATDLREYADVSVDIAAGLGEDVQVLGLSMGGVLAAWTAQERDDVDRVVAIAPAMSIPGVPSFLTTAFINLFDKLPNVSLPGSADLDHVYRGEASKGLVAMFLLGRATQHSANENGPAASEVIIVLNPDDDEVDNADVENFAETWASHDGRVRVEYLPAAGLPHDVIDIAQPDGDPVLVYPILLDLLDLQ